MSNISFIKEVVGTLENRVSTISDIIRCLSNEGYVPNKNKYINLQFAILFGLAYKDNSVFTSEQLNRINILYNKVIVNECKG